MRCCMEGQETSSPGSLGRSLGVSLSHSDLIHRLLREGLRSRAVARRTRLLAPSEMVSQSGRCTTTPFAPATCPTAPYGRMAAAQSSSSVRRLNQLRFACCKCYPVGAVQELSWPLADPHCPSASKALLYLTDFCLICFWSVIRTAPFRVRCVSHSTTLTRSRSDEPVSWSQGAMVQAGNG